MFDPADLINLKRYPISEKGPQLDAVTKQIQSDLEQDGCAVLRGFLTQEGIDALLAEAESVRDRGHRSFNRTNPYFTQDDPALPPDHPKRRYFERSNNFIAADNFQIGGALRSIYHHPHFSPFVQACLREEKFFPYADPLADVIVNMAEAGNGFPWHFDTNNFTVTLAIQNAQEGGQFEYAPNIRRNDENFAEVAQVLDGSSKRVVSLRLEPGDLQLFKGRYSLHRVAPLRGSTPRYVAILSYVDQPDMVATPERCKQLYGRALPIHYQRAGLRSDEFID